MDEFQPGDVILRKAVRSGQEYGWRLDNLAEVVTEAKARQLATIGGQVQFIVPDGTCEAYWLSYDPKEKQLEESGPEYVDRSWSELLDSVSVIDEASLLEAAKHFPVLEFAGVKALENAIFIIYFEAEPDAS